MAKYRKKPFAVEAYQTAVQVDIETLEGKMKAEPGDWIITGIRGERYPIKDDIFKETYELINDLEEGHWAVTVAGARMIQALYPAERSLGYMNIQALIDRYERGERTDALREALQKCD